MQTVLRTFGSKDGLILAAIGSSRSPVAPDNARVLPFADHDALLEEWGAGVALPGDAGVDQIRSAVERILGEPGFTSTSRELAGLFAGPDGAVPAADALEELAAR